MKKRFFLPLVFAILACSIPRLAPRPTSIPLIFPTSRAATNAPATNPSPLGLATVETVAPTPLIGAATSTLATNPFSKILLSAEHIYYGGACAPKEITFEVSVAQPEKVFSVVVFVRLRNLKKDKQTGWNEGLAMNAQGGGRYSYRLKAVNVASYKEFNEAWLQYQFVLTNTQAEIIGRSEVFANKVQFSRTCP
jgi:hypothetical protein